MKIKILTINVWRYHEWEKRKEKLINFLKKEKADVVLFQEIGCGKQKKNQLEEINEKVKYPFFSFGKLMKIKKHKKLMESQFYGFGILSKYPIKHSKVFTLPQVEKNKKFGFMHIVIETQKEKLDLVNVHFENTDKGSKEHLKKTLEWGKKKGIKPIIAGDFNIKKVNVLKKFANDYEISYFIKPYKSFPTKFLHDKISLTLDYIIAHKQKFKFKKIECVNANISNHKPIVAEIEIIK